MSVKVIVCYMTMDFGGFPHKHAQEVMAELGIDYEKSVPQSMADYERYGVKRGA